MPSPIEFWLCASSFNPFNVLIAQPVTDDTCEVIPRLTCSSCHLPPFLFMSKYGLGKGSQKKVWNFPYFSGVGGFEKVIFHKK